MISDPMFYAVAVPAVVMLGLAKGGLSGVGVVAMPLVAMVIPPVQAAAILLPILMIQDVVGVWAFRKTWDRQILAIMIPGSILGIAAGYLLAAKVSGDAVLGFLGAISIVFALHRLWVSRGGRVQAPANAPPWVGAIFGALSGFTSQIAHAGGPPFQMWVMPRGLSPASLVGTTAIFFFAINWLKVPAYMALGQFTRANMMTAAALAPVAIASTFAGVWVIRRIEPARFYQIIYLVMVPMGGYLIWKALAG